MKPRLLFQAPLDNDTSSSGDEETALPRQASIKQESAPQSTNVYSGGSVFRTNEDSDIEDDKVRAGADVGNGVTVDVVKKENIVEDEMDDERVAEFDDNSSKLKSKTKSLESVLKKNLELMTKNVNSKSRISYLNIICKSLNKPGAQEYVSAEEDNAPAEAIKTEDDYDDDFEVKPAKKKRGRKPKSDADKAPSKRTKKEGKRKKETAGKAVKEKKRKVQREAVSGVEDQSGADDTDFDPKDFETTAGEESGSDAAFDSFFDQTIDYKCRFCEDQFKTNDKLLRHYKAIHSQTLETSSLCPECGYTTKSKAMLNRHIRRKHMNITKEKVKQVCEICSAEVYHLAVHKRSLHAGLSFPCPYCGKTFPRKGELQFHIKGIHLKHQLEKTYICEYCHKEFTFYNYLRRHMRVHTNEKPYKCKDCGVGFNHNVSLKNHMNKCSKRELNMSTNSNASNSTTASSVPVRSTVRNSVSGPPRAGLAVVPPPVPNIINEVPPPLPPPAQETINATLARLAGRFDGPLYYY